MTLLEATKQYYDVFLSDLSPRVSGIWDYDHVRQISLSLNALQLVSQDPSKRRKCHLQSI